jgi:dephospho-CoA kinase
MQLIGLSGYARSGKDEAAKVLIEEFGFKRIAFADKLRDFLYALDPIVAVKRLRPRLMSRTAKQLSGSILTRTPAQQSL